MNKAKIGIVGATGYVGVELVRALSGHEGVQLTTLVSQSYVGKKFSDVYPQFRSICDIVLSSLDVSLMKDTCDLVITALPHGVSSKVVPELLAAGLKVLDHSGDFRYREIHVYEEAYGLTHPHPELLSEAVYGIPELYREKIASARLVSDPGCYPTCSILGLAPLLSHQLISTDGIIIDAVSGISGAGRKADLPSSFCEADANYRPYAVEKHRHTSEIEQELSLLAKTDIALTFTPHLAPMKRGMLATIYVDPLDPLAFNINEIHKLYTEFYANEFFVRVLGSKFLPETSLVTGTNFVDISVAYDARTKKVKIFSALDNLGKGAALQAVQAVNVMLGFDEKMGLSVLCSGV